MDKKKNLLSVEVALWLAASRLSRGQEFGFVVCAQAVTLYEDSQKENAFFSQEEKKKQTKEKEIKVWTLNRIFFTKISLIIILSISYNG